MVSSSATKAAQPHLFHDETTTPPALRSPAVPELLTVFTAGVKPSRQPAGWPPPGQIARRPRPLGGRIGALAIIAWRPPRGCPAASNCEEGTKVATNFVC